MAIREIRTFDDQFLHKISKPVDKVDDHIREILNDMAETMYSTENGKAITVEAYDELAKCLCHEADHLDGILFTDKIIEYVDYVPGD